MGNDQQKQDAQAALQQMRQKQTLPPDDTDPGTVLAHNRALEGGNPFISTLLGTGRNMVSPTASIHALWNLIMGRGQGYVQGGPDATKMAENPEGL